MVDCPVFKCRASAVGTIMTEPQKGSKEPLSKTAMTFLKEWLTYQLFKKEEVVRSKYMTKGNQQEEDSFTLINKVCFPEKLIRKNKERIEDEFFTGEPDIILPALVVDAKTSWSLGSFPMFENELQNKDYFWQVQTYCRLAGKIHGQVIFTLIDTPEHLVSKEIYYATLDANKIDMSDDERFRIASKLLYTWKGVQDCLHLFPNAEMEGFIEMPERLRVKVFNVPFDAEKMEAAIERVKLCREYVARIFDEIKDKFSSL